MKQTIQLASIISQDYTDGLHFFGPKQKPNPQMRRLSVHRMMRGVTQIELPLSEVEAKHLSDSTLR